MARKFQHFCPAARTLEKIGEKWSLLIIRDLLRGPQRFTDLLNYLNNITPAWLTRRLRELEATGIIERDSQPGRREVWYRLPPAGRDLGPVVEALSAWGLRYAMRPPLPGEVVHPELLMSGFTSSLNRRGRRLSQVARWSIRFPRAAYTISFDEDHWSQCKGEEPDADLVITATPETFGTMTTVPRNERIRFIREMQIQGKPERVEEFLQIFGIRDREGLSDGEIASGSGQYKTSDTIEGGIKHGLEAGK
jgi:DNA-binding HxlR family transcriptional regulator